MKDKTQHKPHDTTQNKPQHKKQDATQNKPQHKTQDKRPPKAIREQVWITYNKRVFDTKCYVSWCDNIIHPFNFHVGHNKPKSKEGTFDITNLRPICPSCNLSMGHQYTITDWNKLSKKPNKSYVAQYCSIL